MDSVEAELKGQVTHWRVMFISFNSEVVYAKTAAKFFLVHDTHFVFFCSFLHLKQVCTGGFLTVKKSVLSV